MPKLVGLTLTAARAKLSRAGCATPKVVRRTATKARRGRVTRQSRTAGTRLAMTAKVVLTVGR